MSRTNGNSGAHSGEDAEASRAAIKNALSELLTMFPEADLLKLSEDQRAFAIERFVAIDVYRRFQLDLAIAGSPIAKAKTLGEEQALGDPPK